MSSSPPACHAGAAGSRPLPGAPPAPLFPRAVFVCRRCQGPDYSDVEKELKNTVAKLAHAESSLESCYTCIKWWAPAPASQRGREIARGPLAGGRRCSKG